MVELAELQALAYVAQIVGVVGTLTAAFIAVRSYINTNKRAQDARDRELETRQAQVFMAIFDKFSSPEMTKLFGKMETYNIGDLPDYKTWYNTDGPSSFMPIWELWESLGVLVHEGLLDIRIIARAYGNMYRMI